MNTTPHYHLPQFVDADAADLEAYNAGLLSLENDVVTAMANIATNTSNITSNTVAIATKTTLGQAMVMALIFGG